MNCQCSGINASTTDWIWLLYNWFWQEKYLENLKEKDCQVLRQALLKE